MFYRNSLILFENVLQKVYQQHLKVELKAGRLHLLHAKNMIRKRRQMMAFITVSIASISTTSILVPSTESQINILSREQVPPILELCQL